MTQIGEGHCNSTPSLCFRCQRIHQSIMMLFFKLHSYSLSGLLKEMLTLSLKKIHRYYLKLYMFYIML